MAKQKGVVDKQVEPYTSAIPIVAIGASAGGLEAFIELLQHLPSTTGLAYVYIQHLDPNQKSRLSEILGRITAMPVLEAGNMMRVEPNQLYVIPADKDIEVIDGVLTTGPRPRRSALHMPIDQFFTSLADRQKEGAMAVVLSGMDGDGTLGLKAIKAAGGFTFAQNDTARFQSMPKSAIAEGVVDQVLAPAQIAQEIVRLSRQPNIFRQTAIANEQDDPVTPEEELKTVLTYLRKTVGVDFNHYKITTVRRRIIRRMMLHRLETLNDYAAYLRQHADEAAALYNDLLINVTSFFRDDETMDYLRKVLLPQIVREKTPREPLRIWIPACSTGQEAYSLAMLVLEVLGDQAAFTSIQIFATDLSEQAIIKARLGIYSRSEVADVSVPRLQQFFTKIDDHYRVNKLIRDLCVFAPHNLFRDPPFSRLNLVSCRNLLIYLDNVLQRKALSTFHYALNPGGYLILGKSETVGNSVPLFTQIEKDYKVYARKNDVVSRTTFEMKPRFPQIGLPLSDESGRRLPTVGNSDRLSTGPRSVAGAGELDTIVDNLLLTRYVPASVVVNSDLDILQFRGSTSLFLEPAPGKASLNLLRMARPSLTFELRNTVLKAGRANQPVRRTGLEVKVGDKTHYVAIEAAPIPTGSDERLFLVTFQETAPAVLAETTSAKVRNSRIKALEEELETVRRDMHAIIEEQEASNEELQSANEEIISSNEELQSINEELETSKEEIESTNEELLTINQELQIRNEELTEAYEFAEAIFATLREATLVLDGMLRVKSANQTFYELFGTREDETEGRLLYELDGHQWDIPRLRELLEQIMQHDTQVRGFELNYPMPGGADKILLLNARRVVRQGRQEAILLAIEDITEHRHVQHLLADREAWFHNIADNAPVLTWVAGADGRYTFFNRIWLDYTGRTLEDELLRGWAIDMHADDRDTYLDLYKRSLVTRHSFQTEYRLRRADGDYRWMLEYARPTFNTEGLYTGYIGSSTDIHLQKTLTQELDQRVRERTEANVTLQQLNYKLSQAQSIGHVGSFEWNIGDTTTIWSDEMYRLNGLDPQLENIPIELPGQLIHPDDRPAFETLKQQALQTPGRYGLTHRIVWLDGTVRWVYQQFESVADDEAQVSQIRGILQDVTDHVLAQKQISETAENLQAVLNNSPACIGYLKAVFDQPDELHGDPAVDRIIDFRLVVANEQFARLVGQPVPELIGQSANQLAGMFWGVNTFDRLKQIIDTKQPYYEERQYVPDNDGADARQWIGLSVSRHEDGIVLTGLDITDLRQAEEEQNRLLTELEKSQHTLQYLQEVRRQVRERGEFLRSTTHDLRSSFGVAQGAATLLDLPNTDEERAKMMAMLQRNLSQTAQMLTQLLDFSRLESGQDTVQIEPFDAAVVLRELGESMQSMADQKNLWIRLEGVPSLMVTGDAIKVRRITQNLVLNALKYTKAGGVTLRWVAAGDDHWTLDVEDSGPGLSASVVAFMTSGTNEEGSLPSSSGEGIGLMIVKQLIRLLQASLVIDNRPGNGTRFRVTMTR